MARFTPPAVLALAMIAAGPAFAQAPICGGISLVGEWVGGDEAASDLSAMDAAYEGGGRVPIAGHLVRMFTVSAPVDVRIDARAVPSGDPYMTLYDAAGTEVAADDDSLGDFGARVRTSLEPGRYCLAVRSYEPGVTDVALAIGPADAAFGDDFPATPPPGTAPGDAVQPLRAADGAGCFETGTPTLGEELDADILADGSAATASAATAPAYGFSLAEAIPLTVTATSIDGDPLIRIVDRDGTVLAENDDFDGLDSRIDLGAPLAPGAYCIEVEDLNGDANTVTVALGLFDPAIDRARRLALAEFAPTAADDVEVVDLGPIETSLLREIEMRGGARWFRFDLPTGGLLLTEAVGDGADPIVTLFDRAGRRIGKNDDGPDGLDSFLVSRLLPGAYTLAVRLADGADGSGAVRLLMERFVPAE